MIRARQAGDQYGVQRTCDGDDITVIRAEIAVNTAGHDGSHSFVWTR